MIVIAWKGGSTDYESAAGYGLKVSIEDRDRYFKQEWKSVMLYLADPLLTTKVNIDKASFWNETCHELISKDIGTWFLNHNYAPWPKGKPPKFFLEPITEGRFLVYPIPNGLIEAIKKSGEPVRKTEG